MRSLISLMTDKGGNFALLTAVVAPVVIGIAGIAVDFNIGIQTKATLQGAVDAAILAAASSGETDEKTLRVLFDKALKANYVAPDGNAPNITSFKRDGKYVTVTADINIPLTFTRVLTNRPFKAAVLSQAIAGNSNLVDIALVLDNTASMSGQKLTDLKKASNSLLDVFEKADTKKTQARFALVPFSKYINVGLDQRNQPWLSVAADTSTTQRQCSKPATLVSQDCKTVTETRYNDGVPSQWTGPKCNNTYSYGDEVCQDKTTNTKWFGCIYSRAEKLDVVETDAISKKYTGIMGTASVCGAPIQPLTNNYNGLRAALKAMVANSNTYIAPGILWGLNLLSPVQPFTEGYDYTPQNQKYIVLMTDGANTIIPAYKKNQDWTSHSDIDFTNPSNPSQVNPASIAQVAQSDTLLTTTCGNAKALGIKIFTVAVGVTESGTATALASCASTKDMAFSVKDTSTLTQIFGAIAAQIMTPRLTM